MNAIIAKHPMLSVADKLMNDDGFILFWKLMLMSLLLFPKDVLAIPTTVRTKPIVIANTVNGTIKVSTPSIIIRAKSKRQNAIVSLNTPGLPIPSTSGFPGVVKTRPIVITKAVNGVLRIKTDPIKIYARKK